MHCQKATAQAILDRGGDYVLALKANQPALLDDVRPLLDDPAAPPDDVAATFDGDHGRIEVRRRGDRPRRRLARRRRTAGRGSRRSARSPPRCEIDGQATAAIRYFLLSKPAPGRPLRRDRPDALADRERPALVLDLVMDEDQSRSRQDHGPENLARLRRFALNLLRANPDQGSPSA